MDSTSTPASIPSVEQFLNASLATETVESMEQELETRRLKKPFPLHIFNPKIKPYIEALHREYNIPRSYIGLSMLAAYSSAVGTAYHVKIHALDPIYFPVWACLEGISSAGKSLIMGQVFKPLFKFQKEMEADWFEAIKGKNEGQIAEMISKHIIYGEAHIPTLINSIMKHNPKGILQDADEILSWINGMNQLSKGGKEGTDEQFWMKSWNCRTHRKTLSGNKIFVIDRPFLNVFGGAQPSIMWKLFKNDRDTTGFIYRLLFAVPEVHKIAEPNLMYMMPPEFEEIHHKCLSSLYKGLPVDDETDSRTILIDSRALAHFTAWRGRKIKEVNAIQDINRLQTESGILGKMTEYTMRFCGLLHLADLAYDHKDFGYSEVIGMDTMKRALEAVEYFYESAKNVTERASTSMIATPEIIRIATFVRQGYTYQQIGDREWPTLKEDARRVKASRMVKKFINEYPKIFGAEGK